MQIESEHNDLSLPSYENWKVVELLENLSSEPIPACMVLVEPRVWRTGYNEEIADWVANFWKEVFEENPTIQGRRFSWGIVLFVAPQNSLAEMKDLILKVLADSIHPELTSRTLFSFVQNSFEEKIREVEQMELQLNKINYWKEHIYPSYFEDGMEKSLI